MIPSGADVDPAVRQTIFRRHLASFIYAAFLELHPGQPLEMAAHVEVIATALEKVRRGEIKRLIINLPPRSLKSHSVSVAFVAWLLGHDPSKHIICASYGQDLANDLATLCRRLMRSPLYRSLFGEVLGQRQAVEDFETLAGGRRMATSVGGALTGRGADLIIVDDPLKADDALSEASRKATHTWFDNTLLSRLNDRRTGAIIIVTQRLHQDDLVGHVLENEEWELLSLPAIAETEEEHVIEDIAGRRFFRRSPGDVLQPARETPADLQRLRQAMSTFSFASQYQQNPIPLEGAIVKIAWLSNRYEPGEEPARFSFVVQSWDTANKASDLADYSVCTTWGYLNKRFYLLHVFRAKFDFPDLKREARLRHEQFRPDKVLIEDKASGQQLIQELKADGLFAVEAYSPPPGADKIMRLITQTNPFENGQVLLPRHAPWLAEYVTELTGFPGSRYADQVDSTTQALDYMRNKLIGTAMPITDEMLVRARRPRRRQW
jgi:predicted phage terminase large subunit-like protein